MLDVGLLFKKCGQGRLSGSVSLPSNFGSGHDFMVRGFKPCIGLCADSSSLFQILCLLLSAPPMLALCLFLSQKKKKKVRIQLY